MATHLVKILSKNGTLEFPAPLAHFFLASVSVWNTQCLCGTHTVSLWQAHSVSVAFTQGRCAGGGGQAVGGREVRVKV